MQQFIVVPAPTPDFAALVTATSYRRPDEYLCEVAQELKSRGICGAVVLDLAAANGTRSRRFFVMPFDQGKFIAKRFEHLSAPSDRLRRKADEVIRMNAAVIDMSLMTDGMRSEILMGPLSLDIRPYIQACSCAGLRALGRC